MHAKTCLLPSSQAEKGYEAFARAEREKVARESKIFFESDQVISEYCDHILSYVEVLRA
jgi:hypothetical protein